MRYDKDNVQQEDEIVGLKLVRRQGYRHSFVVRSIEFKASGMHELSRRRRRN